MPLVNPACPPTTSCAKLFVGRPFSHVVVSTMVDAPGGQEVCYGRDTHTETISKTMDFQKYIA